MAGFATRILFAFALLLPVSGAFGAQCDVDDDGFVDRVDISAIAATRGQLSTGPEDPRDADGDGVISVLDARTCVRQCSLPRCAEQPDQVAVPDVTGLMQATAEANIIGAGLSVGAVGTATSSSVPAGNVIGQSPLPGALVVLGALVDLTISLGPELATTPDVVGLPQAAAEAAIVAADLSVGTVSTDNSDAVLAGSVISQDPSGGTLLPPGSPVDLVISLGPALVPTPDVVGLPQAAAEAAIVAADLSVGTVSSANSATVPTGDVISQDPSGGTLLPPGSPVALVISLGPVLATTPDVVGLPQTAAEGAIVAAGLSVGGVSTDNSPVPAGSVIGQDPSGGTLLPPGSPVDLLVSLGPLIPDVNTVEADADPDVIPIGGVSTITCRAFEASGDEILPTPTATIATVTPGVLTGNQFTSAESADVPVTCSIDGVEGVIEVVILPEDGDPAFGDVAASFETLSDLGEDVTSADEAEDIPALQAAKDAIAAAIAAIDLAALAANPPLPLDADLPTNQQLLDAGDVPDAGIDAAWSAAILALRQNLLDYQSLLSGLTIATVTDADAIAQNDLTTAVEALLPDLGLTPSVTAILALNDEVNEISALLLPGQTVDVGQFNIEVIATAPGIVYRNWEFQTDTPEALYAGFSPAAISADRYYDTEAKAFSLLSVMTSQSIANSLRSQMIKRVYKPIWKAWRKAAQFIKDNSLDTPVGIDPPTLDLLLPSILSKSGGQIFADGTNFVPGNTQVKINTNKGGPLLFDLAGDEFFGTAFYTIPFSCSFFSPCTAVISIVTPGGESNTIGRNIF